MAGYQEDFLNGIILPLPTFDVALSSELYHSGEVFHYPNYSVIMNVAQEKRSPVVVCLNIDQSEFKNTTRSNRWRADKRIGNENQLDDAYYAHNDWDRGHMAMRSNAGWGPTPRDAQHAADETFYFSNACLQHANLNQDEWFGLEKWVYDLSLDADDLITSFSGPIYGDHDRTIKPSGRTLALIPAGFFKIVCFKNKSAGELDVRAFVMYQDNETLKDKSGRKRYDNQTYQVTVTEIENLTGLRFDDQIYHSNPLYFNKGSAAPSENVVAVPERIEVAKSADIIAKGDKRQTINDDIVDIYIAAAMVGLTGSDKANEWISLMNLGETTVDITGWCLKDNKGNALVIDSRLTKAASRILAPGQSVVIKGLEPLQLSDKQDVIQLFDGDTSDSARIDWVNYTENMVTTGKPVLFLTPRNTLS